MLKVPGLEFSDEFGNVQPNIDPVQTYHFSEYIIIQCNGACAEMYLLGR